MALTLDDETRAKHALIIAKSCYYHDVSPATNGTVPLFDDLNYGVQLRYMDLADYILFNLEDYIG